MTRTIEYKNPKRLKIIRKLKRKGKEKHTPIYNTAAKELSRVRKNRREVNIGKINEITKEDDIVLVPGKVLGNGLLEHRVEIAAFAFTQGAKNKIQESKSTAMTIDELMEKNPSGSGVKLIG